MKNRKSKRIVSLLCGLCAVLSLMTEGAFAASSYCPYCDAFRSYTYEYVAKNEDYHMERMWCSSCGLDMNEGVISSEHSYVDYGDYLMCTDCGYQLEAAVSCSHTSTRTTWDGCDWSEYCRGCGELVDYGTSHGDYEYGDWMYYNSSRHRRLYACVDCGEGSYSYGYHSTTEVYEQKDGETHSVSNYCSTCSTTISSGSEDHSFTYGNWSSYNDTQHRRLATCSDCGYSTYEYASHPLSYGAWSNNSSTQHRRAVSCNTCSYSTYEYEDHPLSYGVWSSDSDTQHKRTVGCTTCAYSTNEYGDHADEDDNGSCDVCEHVMTVFSVTVPASLKMVVSKEGEVYAAESAAIANHSTGSIVASAITIDTANGWTIAPYHSSMAGEKVDSNKIGFSLNGAATKASGSREVLVLSADDWTIEKGTELPLQYDAVVSAVSEPVDTQVLTITFVFTWA